MAEPNQLLYLEPDDEITSVVRRLREADAGRVVLVASGRSKPIASVVALRLLAGIAAEEQREIALVADAPGRALAGEAGIPAFASVAEANAEGATPVEPPATRRAPIHVVRGESAPPPAPPEVDEPSPPRFSAAGDETQTAVPVPAPAAAPLRRPRPQVRRPRPFSVRTLPRAVIGAAVALVLLAGGLVAAVAPAATIVIEPASVEVGPVEYAISVAPSGTDEGQLEAEATGTATGVHTDPSPASGTVVFLNWNTVVVEVPQGTQVAAGDIVFSTVETINVPNGQFGLPIVPGEASVGVVAAVPGPAGNVEAEAINAVLTNRIAVFLRGFPNNPNRLVTNPDATAGGSDNEEPEITQADVDAAAAAVRQDLQAQLDDRLGEEAGRLYGPVDAGEALVPIPDDLVGRRGEASFALEGTLAYSRPWVDTSDVEAAARERLMSDTGVVPEGHTTLADSVEVEIGTVSAAGDSLEVEVTLRAEAAPVLDEAAIRERVKGLTDAEVLEALRPLGDVSVHLWPDWVDRVPALDWRIDVRLEGELAPTASPAESQ